jgi:hypothetical protein
MCNDYEIRADNNDLKSLKSMLTESLEKRAISHCSVGLTVLGNATKRGIPANRLSTSRTDSDTSLQTWSATEQSSFHAASDYRPGTDGLHQ